MGLSLLTTDSLLTGDASLMVSSFTGTVVFYSGMGLLGVWGRVPFFIIEEEKGQIIDSNLSNIANTQ